MLDKIWNITIKERHQNNCVQGCLEMYTYYGSANNKHFNLIPVFNGIGRLFYLGARKEPCLCYVLFISPASLAHTGQQLASTLLIDKSCHHDNKQG